MFWQACGQNCGGHTVKHFCYALKLHLSKLWRLWLLLWSIKNILNILSKSMTFYSQLLSDFFPQTFVGQTLPLQKFQITFWFIKWLWRNNDYNSMGMIFVIGLCFFKILTSKNFGWTWLSEPIKQLFKIIKVNSIKLVLVGWIIGWVELG